ncbi:MAG: hypothetical protein EOP88_04700 [Verrucomicrobiaceae bacterium]|nr:MAG: hypothetical protein EOP88_04700 [Verrucomicrobiaceae bacterium]
MKPSRILALFLLLAASADAAISIVIQPGITPDTTIFTVTQTAPNPTANVAGLSGYVMGMSIPTAMFNIPGLGPGFSSDVWGSFTTALGTVTDTYSGQSLTLDRLRISSNPAVASVFGSQSILIIPTGHSELRFEFASAGSVETQISYAALVPGVHTAPDTLFGEVTVTVVPEPSALMIGMASMPLFLRRRRG